MSTYERAQKKAREIEEKRDRAQAKREAERNSKNKHSVPPEEEELVGILDQDFSKLAEVMAEKVAKANAKRHEGAVDRGSDDWSISSINRQQQMYPNMFKEMAGAEAIEHMRVLKDEGTFMPSAFLLKELGKEECFPLKTRLDKNIGFGKDRGDETNESGTKRVEEGAKLVKKKEEEKGRKKRKKKSKKKWKKHVPQSATGRMMARSQSAADVSDKKIFCMLRKEAEKRGFADKLKDTISGAKRISASASALPGTKWDWRKELDTELKREERRRVVAEKRRLKTNGGDERSVIKIGKAVARRPTLAKLTDSDIERIKAKKHFGVYSIREVRDIHDTFHRLDTDGSLSLDWREFRQGMLELFGTKYPPGPDGDAQRVARLAELDSMFQVIDKDKSGELDPSEAVALLFPKSSGQHRRDIIKLLWQNNLERVYGIPEPEQAEVEDQKEKTLSEEDENDLRQLFRLYDTDKSGGVSVVELKDALSSQGMSNVELLNLIKGADLDGNKEVDEEEFILMMRESWLLH